MLRRGRQLLIVTAVSAFAIAGLGHAAQAGPGKPEKLPVSVVEFDAATVQAHSRRADQIDSADQDRKGYARKYLDDQARRGRLLDETQVRVAALADPGHHDKKVHVAWDGPRAPKVQLQTVGVGDNTAQRVDAVLEGDDPDAVAGPLAASGGAGYDAAFSVSNMYKSSNRCTTVWFTPSYYSAGEDHQLVTCYEKWAQGGTDHWIYNRWGLWTRARVQTGGIAQTREFTIRSRPWKGQEYKVRRLNFWEPKGPTSTCQDLANVTLGGTYGGVTGSISIPVRTCSNTILKVDSTVRMIGIGIEGSEYGRQMRIDVAGDFNAADRYVVPVWADYVWAQVDYGWIDPEKYYYTWRESGW